MVRMLIICFVVSHGQMQEAWRIDKMSDPKICLQMDQLFSGGGSRGAITVKCGEWSGTKAGGGV